VKLTAGTFFRRMSARLIIVSGLPATGKTTLARALEAELGAVRCNADEWLLELGLDLLDDRSRKTVERLQWAFAQRLLEHGAVVVIEWGTWSRAHRDTLRRRARELGAGVELRFLDADPEELWARDQTREPALRAYTRESLMAWFSAIERPDAAELARFDPPV
jgi:predicted kinase